MNNYLYCLIKELEDVFPDCLPELKNFSAEECLRRIGHREVLNFLRKKLKEGT